MKKHLSTIILVAIFLVGLSVMLYPTFSDFWNSFHQSQAIAQYDEAVSKLSENDTKKLLKEAKAYNDRLWQRYHGTFSSESMDDYEKILNVAGNGVMGYVSIKKIRVELPIYHGTDEAVLEIAAGHMEGTSLPVGGKNTHCVLSGHRGLPSAKLFTDLDKLEEGDTFTITVLNRLITYQVDQILIVDPSHTEDLNIQAGKDYCTLLTCTPYGVNTHRMLIRGRRISNLSSAADRITSEAVKIDPITAAPLMAIPLLLLLLIGLLVRRKQKKQGKEIGYEEE